MSNPGNLSPSILILGHSFVSKLRTYAHLNHGNINMGAPLDKVTVFMRGIPGAYLSGIMQEVDLIQELRPKLVILQIGSNDLSSPTVNPVSLAEEIIQFAQLILDTCNPEKVVVSEIFFRDVQRASRRWQCRPDYNKAVTTTNNKLRELSH